MNQEARETVTPTHWNYRLIRHVDPQGTWFAIHEVHYAKKHRPLFITEQPVALMSESRRGAKKVFALMKRALKKPILDFETLERVKT